MQPLNVDISYISGTPPRVPNSSDDITKHCRLVAFYSDEEAAVADVLLEASANSGAETRMWSQPWDFS